MKKRRIISFIICACLMIGYFPAVADNDVILISSVSDFKSFSKKCSLDSWSEGKTVILEKDIDVSGTSAVPVPIFKGTFDGQGFTVSGVNISKNSSVAGLFRYIDGGGIVKNLEVSGTIEPGGTKTTIGGIVGENKGVISNCVFNGKVKGTTNIGGIAGINDGQILNCMSEGTIYGEHYVGGTVGKNFGSIVLCQNYANVNITEEVVDLDLESINLENLRSTENVADITDIGGVTGFSSGVVQSCENNGDVGYEHVGYNIGGIAGRQSGYLDGCTNTGTIHGRKDVGGIVGQTEPHTILKYSKESLASLNDELDRLTNLVDKAVNDSRNSKSVISDRLTTAKGHINEARSISEDLIDKANAKLNDGIDDVNKIGESVNDLSARAGKMIDKTLTATEKISNSTDKIKDIVDEYRDTFDAMSDVFDDEVDTQLVSDGLKNLSDATSNLSKAVKYMAKGMDRFRSSLGDQSDKKVALMQISEGVKMYSDAMTEIKKSADAVSSANDNLKSNIKDSVTNDVTDKIKYKINGTDDSETSTNAEDSSSTTDTTSTLKAELTNLIDSLTTQFNSVSSSAKNAADGASKVISGLNSLAATVGDWDVAELYNGLEYLEISVDLMRTAMDQMAGATKNLYGAWSGLKRALEGSKEIWNEDDTKGDRLSDEVENISDAFGEIRDAISEFNKDPIITYEKIDSVYFEEKDQLSESITNISNAIDGVRDSVGSFGDIVIDDIESISNQMAVIFDCLADSVDEAKNKSMKAEDYIEDVSEFDVASQTDGKVSDSINRGNVKADLNVGGIVGSMAVEYDFDPEDDVVSQGDKSLNFLYTTKSVVRGCTNEGNVTAKKNYSGGVVGKADLGMIVESLGKGKIESESGGYVGGVAGQSESLIRSSYAKCTLLGDNYIGGIAGEGNRVLSSYAMVNLEKYNEHVGAIAGEIKNSCKACLFVGDDIGGIDDISYSGKAEPVSYEEFIERDDVPNDFRRFTLTFVADNTIVGEVEFEYGIQPEKDEIPKVPQKDGCYGVWEKEDFSRLTYDEVINAVYESYITAVSSEEKRDSGLSVVVAEGDFSSTSKIKLTEEKSGKNSEKWTVEITDNDSDEVLLHYLPEMKPEEAKIYVVTDGKEKRVDAAKDGSYLVFSARGDGATFIVYKKLGIGKILLYIVFLAFVLTAFFAFRLKKKAKIYGKQV